MGGNDRPELKSSYASWVARVAGVGEGLRFAIGANFEAFGIIEAEMLRYYGARPDFQVIDVGCGSGRLSGPLSSWLAGTYLGTDVVPALLTAARATVTRPGWRFELVDTLTIPERDEGADMVCFFSVLTHLLHEQSYLYLAEAWRVLRPGGRVVISFLEFALPLHWNVFESTLRDERERGGHPLNMFIERHVLALWADRLGFAVVEFRDGDDAFVPLPLPLPLEDGRVMKGFGNLGQSICVLEKP